MATYIGGAPKYVTGGVGISYGSSRPVTLINDTKASAASAAQSKDLSLAFIANKVYSVIATGGLARRISVRATTIDDATTTTTPPAIYLYGVFALSSEARATLEAGNWPSDGQVRAVRLDADSWSDAPTPIPLDPTQAFNESGVLFSDVPNALYQIDLQGAEYVVALLGTAMVNNSVATEGHTVEGWLLT